MTPRAPNCEGHFPRAAGTIPSVWGLNQTWTNFPSSPGFTNLQHLYLDRANLSGTLPSAFGAVIAAGRLLNGANAFQVDICDNLFSGTVPASWSVAGYYLSLAMNPLLVGTAPALPTAWGGNCGGYTYFGTSIGLDQPMAYILANVSAALDPSGAILPSWRTGSVQPCVWASQPGGLPTSGQPRLGYGGAGYLGITCATTGAVSTLVLNPVTPLNGTIPVELYKLKTATSINVRPLVCPLSTPPRPRLRRLSLLCVAVTRFESSCTYGAAAAGEQCPDRHHPRRLGRRQCDLEQHRRLCRVRGLRQPYASGPVRQLPVRADPRQPVAAARDDQPQLVQACSPLPSSAPLTSFEQALLRACPRDLRAAFGRRAASRLGTSLPDSRRAFVTAEAD